MRLPTLAASAALLFTSMVTSLPHASPSPYSSPSSNKTQPLKDILTYHPAASHNALGISILVLPGGGYSYVSLDREGTNATLYLNAKGYDAWVLNYTTASTPNAPVPLYPTPMDEAANAVRYIREQEDVHVGKLGIWGFSAGGHLAAVTLTDPDIQKELDFGILTYPVISMEEGITHNGSRINLIGDNPSPDLVQEMSAEKRVTEGIPPTFVYASADDATVPVENTLAFMRAMSKVSRPYQALILPDAEHGIALGLEDPARNWTPELGRFLAYSV